MAAPSNDRDADQEASMERWKCHITTSKVGTEHRFLCSASMLSEIWAAMEGDLLLSWQESFFGFGCQAWIFCSGRKIHKNQILSTESSTGQILHSSSAFSILNCPQISGCLAMEPPISDHPRILELCRLLGNHDIADQLAAALPLANGSNVLLRIEASLCSSADTTISPVRDSPACGGRMLLVRLKNLYHMQSLEWFHV